MGSGPPSFSIASVMVKYVLIRRGCVLRKFDSVGIKRNNVQICGGKKHDGEKRNLEKRNKVYKEEKGRSRLWCQMDRQMVGGCNSNQPGDCSESLKN